MAEQITLSRVGMWASSISQQRVMRQVVAVLPTWSGSAAAPCHACHAGTGQISFVRGRGHAARRYQTDLQIVRRCGTCAKKRVAIDPRWSQWMKTGTATGRASRKLSRSWILRENRLKTDRAYPSQAAAICIQYPEASQSDTIWRLAKGLMRAVNGPIGQRISSLDQGSETSAIPRLAGYEDWAPRIRMAKRRASRGSS